MKNDYEELMKKEPNSREEKLKFLNPCENIKHFSLKKKKKK